MVVGKGIVGEMGKVLVVMDGWLAAAVAAAWSERLDNASAILSAPFLYFKVMPGKNCWTKDAHLLCLPFKVGQEIKEVRLEWSVHTVNSTPSRKHLHACNACTIANISNSPTV